MADIARARNGPTNNASSRHFELPSTGNMGATDHSPPANPHAQLASAARPILPRRIAAKPGLRKNHAGPRAHGTQLLDANPATTTRAEAPEPLAHPTAKAQPGGTLQQPPLTRRTWISATARDRCVRCARTPPGRQLGSKSNSSTRPDPRFGRAGAAVQHLAGVKRGHDSNTSTSWRPRRARSRIASPSPCFPPHPWTERIRSPHPARGTPTTMLPFLPLDGMNTLPTPCTGRDAVQHNELTGRCGGSTPCRRQVRT